MHRFFVKSENIYEDKILITGDDVSHISKVLRLKEGDSIVLCDGESIDYNVKIEQIDKQSVKTVIVDKYISKSEPTIEVTLFQSIPKGTKMEIIIQKCVEMGIFKIVPVLTSRTVVKLECQKDQAKKVERWNKISNEAAKQSGRGRIPEITMPIEFSEAIKKATLLDFSIIPYELERQKTIKKAISGNKSKSIGIFIGPEGGFEEAEIKEALESRVVPVTLGHRILRTETAGMVVLGCIMYELDQMIIR